MYNPVVIDQAKNIDAKPFFYYETFQTSDILPTTTQVPAVNLALSTISSPFMTFDYPKDFSISPENQQQNEKYSENNNHLTETSASQVPSICSYDPCLNNGNCIPITNSNSLFKFRCICPENFTGIIFEVNFMYIFSSKLHDFIGILCENSETSQNGKINLF